MDSLVCSDEATVYR